MESKHRWNPGSTITLEKGVDFEAEKSPDLEACLSTNYYFYGGHVLKVFWVMVDYKIQCRLVEIDGKQIGLGVMSEWLSAELLESSLKQKRLLLATIKKAGITVVSDDVRELPENVYVKMAGLNELANLIK